MFLPLTFCTCTASLGQFKIGTTSIVSNELGAFFPPRLSLLVLFDKERYGRAYYNKLTWLSLRQHYTIITPYYSFLCWVYCFWCPNYVINILGEECCCSSGSDCTTGQVICGQRFFFGLFYIFFCEKNVVSLLKLIALYEIKYVIRVSIRLIVTITIIIIIIHENKRNWIFTYDLFAVITREESDASHMKTIKESNSLTNAKANISVKNLLCCIHVFVAFFVAVYGVININIHGE